MNVQPALAVAPPEHDHPSRAYLTRQADAIGVSPVDIAELTLKQGDADILGALEALAARGCDLDYEIGELEREGLLEKSADGSRLTGLGRELLAQYRAHHPEGR